MTPNKTKIINILKQLDIPFWISGKNVSNNSVNITCPFCPDHSNHCGIFQDNLIYHCWRCGSTGPLQRLLCYLTGYSEEQCKKLVEEPYHNFKKSPEDQIKDIVNKDKPDTGKKSQDITEISMPEYSQLITWTTKSKLLDAYMSRRNISLSTLIAHECSLCEVGYYMHRLIIPIYFFGILVSYQAADLTGRAHVKYDTAPGDISNYLYGIDFIDRRMIVVEGILDAWRVGKDACASFTHHLTKRQQDLILNKNLEELIFCYDGDSYFKARKHAREFEYAVNKVNVIKLPTGEDPDSLGREKILELIRGNHYETSKAQH